MQDCARILRIVIVAVPWDGHGETLSRVRDGSREDRRRLLESTGGLHTRRARTSQGGGGSAAEQAESWLPQSRSARRFHHVSASADDRPEHKGVDSTSWCSVTTARRSLSSWQLATGSRACGDPRRTSSQRRPGGGDHGEPDRHQSPLQGARRSSRDRPVCFGRWSGRPRGCIPADRTPPPRLVSLVPSLTEAVAVTAPECSSARRPTAPIRLTSTYHGSADQVAGHRRDPGATHPTPSWPTPEENRREDVEALRAAGVAVGYLPTHARRRVDESGLGCSRRSASPSRSGWTGPSRRCGHRRAAARHGRRGSPVACARGSWSGRIRSPAMCLRRLGVTNQDGRDRERYPRPALDEIRASGRSGCAAG